MYLRIALELPLKRLIVGGFDKVYELSRVFRNEGMDPTHNPEFTMLETYEAYADYEDVMKMVEELLYDISLKIKGTDTVIYQEDEISFKPPFKRSRMVDLVKEHTGVDFDLIDDQAEAYSEGIKLGLEIEKHTSIGKIIEEAFDTFVEDKLIQPTFVTHHPVDISPLAKKDYNNPKYTERFELFIRGSEYANAFSELNDPIDQKARFVGQVENKNSGDDEAHPYDHDFINALEVGLPPTGGLGIGVDRLVMLMTDQRSIRDVILFPTMKPEISC
jgi:lysyl-tRNA synthetase class 2